MRENCTYGSEGGAASAVPTPIRRDFRTPGRSAALGATPRDFRTPCRSAALGATPRGASCTTARRARRRGEGAAPTEGTGCRSVRWDAYHTKEPATAVSRELKNRQSPPPCYRLQQRLRKWRLPCAGRRPRGAAIRPESSERGHQPRPRSRLLNSARHQRRTARR